MSKVTKPVLPSLQRRFKALGERVRLARLRRHLPVEEVCARAQITRATHYRIEQGDPSVSMRNYAAVLAALQLDADLDLLAKDDALGRRLQDLEITTRSRAPRRSKRATEGPS